MNDRAAVGSKKPWVVFDFFGVVVLDATSDYLAGIADAQLAERVRTLNAEKDLGDLSLEDYIASLVALLGVTEAKARWLECPDDTARPQVAGLMKSLKPHCRLAIASNCYAPSLRRAIKVANIEHDIDLVLASSELRSIKPQAAFWQQATQLLSAPSAQIYFVDDRLENVRAAEDFGWQAMHFTGVDDLRTQLTELGYLHGVK